MRGRRQQQRQVGVDEPDPEDREAGQDPGGGGEGLRLGVQRRPHRPDQQRGEHDRAGERGEGDGPGRRPATCSAGSYGNVGSGTSPTSAEQVGEQQRRERDQDALAGPEDRPAGAPVAAVLAQPGVAGGEQRREQQGEREQRERPAGDEVVADADVVVGPGVGGLVGAGRG